MSLHAEVYHILETTEVDHPFEQPVRYALGALIALNVLAAILETVPTLKPYYGLLSTFENASIGVFVLEYLARVWSSVEGEEEGSFKRVRFALRPLMLLDLIVIIVSIAPAFLDIRTLRALRLIRLLKFGRYSKAVRVIGRVLTRKRDEFTSCLILALLVLIISSTLMYYAEHNVQPEVFSSIPATMWWGVATLTTVGYGDVAPITPLGKLIGALVAMSAIGVFGLPSGVLASGFIEELSSREQEPLEDENR